MKRSALTKTLVIIVLVFFLLSTGLMFVLYLASPATILNLEDTDTNTSEQTIDDTQFQEQEADEVLIQEEKSEELKEIE
jgi:flagellar basal body-associated protein FliL